MFRRAMRWLALALVAGAAGALALQLFLAGQGKTGGIWSQLAIVAVGLLAALAHLATTDLGVKGPKGRDWLSLKALAGIVVSAIAGFSAASLLLSVMDPQPAIESARGAIESKLIAIDERSLTEEKARALAASQAASVSGIWGEPGCAVAYRVAVDDDVFQSEAILRPVGAAPHVITGRVISAEGGAVEIAGVAPASFKGISLTLLVRSEGGQRVLVWRDNTRSSEENFVPCGGVG